MEPRWIAFAECTKSRHRFDCSCSEFPKSYLRGRITATQRSAQELDKRCRPDDCADVDPLAQERTETGQQSLSGTLASHADDQNQICDSRFDRFPDDDSNDAEIFYDLDHCLEEDENFVIDALEYDNSDPFKAIAHHLHCAQGRTWLGSYKPGELVCGNCFLRREGFVSETGKDDDSDYLSSMPPMFCEKPAEE